MSNIKSTQVSSCLTLYSQNWSHQTPHLVPRKNELKDPQFSSSSKQFGFQFLLTYSPNTNDIMAGTKQMLKNCFIDQQLGLPQGMTKISSFALSPGMRPLSISLFLSPVLIRGNTVLPVPDPTGAQSHHSLLCRDCSVAGSSRMRSVCLLLTKLSL